MDNTILKKRLSSFKTSKGHFIKVSDEVLVDLLRSWEQWTGKSKDFCQSIGINVNQFSFLIGKAKKVRREGHYPEEEFKEVKLEPSPSVSYCGVGIELCLEGGKVLRFSGVEQVLDFLKKSGS